MNTINKIQVDGVIYNIKASLLTKVTYAELKEMRDKGSLAEGHLYRITDYEFTTKQTNTKSASNVFDIIVLATTENQLSELARAIQHEGDTYFDGNDLGAWELWYDLDNDTDKYEWADAENGKGVIYRMIDEKCNDCPYDFKNALFYNTTLTYPTTTDKYYYTFSYVVNSVLYDGTVEKQVKDCYDNSMGVYLKSNSKKSLNLNVFRNTLFKNICYNNKLGIYCGNNTFGNNSVSNKFGRNCNKNTLGNGCYSNTFWDNYQNNTLGDTCYNNTFEGNCNNNTLGSSCYSNNFGDNCNNNTLGDNCKNNKFENNCYFNIFKNSCQNNKFGNYCEKNTLGISCRYNTFGNNVCNRELNTSETSITLNDEYYDDGSGQLVPIKHPDLSTQPSILPYKFMGQYVYLQLIPVNKSLDEINNASFGITVNEFNSNIFLRPNVGVLEANLVLFTRHTTPDGDLKQAAILCIPVKLQTEQELGKVVGIMVSSGSFYKNNISLVSAWLRIVYTSMPEEGGDSYGYNNY